MQIPGSWRAAPAYVWRALDTHPVRTVLIAGALFTLALVNVKLFAAGGPWWRGWADQRAYLDSARAFAGLDFSAARHWYPLVYPLTGAPFAAWLAAPFVPVDIACFGIAFYGFSRVCAALGVGARTAALLFLATTLLDPRIAKLWVEPWTTTPSAALLWLAFGLVADLRSGAGFDRRRALVLGLALAAIPLVRPADVVVGALVALFALGPVLRRRLLLPVLGGGVAIVAVYGALHVSIYGPRASDYMLLSQAYGLNIGDLGWKLQVLLLDPAPWFPGEVGLLRAMPWLVPGAAGLVLALVRLRGEARMLAAWLCAAALVYCVTLFAYVDLLPSGMWRFNNVHYFKWLLPLFGLGAVLLVREGARAPLGAVAALVAVLLPTCLRAVPVPVAADAPAKALVFDAAPALWADIYAARATIADRRGVQRNIFDYHQIQRPDGRVVAVALKRRFAGDEAWRRRVADDAALWPHGAPVRDVTMGGAWPRAPRGRYDWTLGVGVPCWIVPAACVQTLAE
ncbi:hypothetical protein ACG3SL_06110 [Sphingomonas sp. CJ20]